MYKKTHKQKPKVSQDQVDWLMMELQTTRENYDKNKNNQ